MYNGGVALGVASARVGLGGTMSRKKGSHFESKQARLYRAIFTDITDLDREAIHKRVMATLTPDQLERYKQVMGKAREASKSALT